MSDQQHGRELDGWVPQNERQHPPFQPGNLTALQHGVFSRRTVDPLARELVEQVLTDPATAYLTAAHWQPALWAWGRAEAQIQLLTNYLAKAGEESDDGVGDLDEDRVNRAYLLLHRAEARATTQRTRLGLDPLSAARLGKDRASAQFDAARAMAELERQERERQEREGGDDG